MLYNKRYTRVFGDVLAWGVVLSLLLLFLAMEGALYDFYARESYPPPSYLETLFKVLVGIFTLCGLPLWVWMLTDAIHKSYRKSLNQLWLILLILWHVMAASVYYFSVKRRELVPYKLNVTVDNMNKRIIGDIVVTGIGLFSIYWIFTAFNVSSIPSQMDYNTITNDILKADRFLKITGIYMPISAGLLVWVLIDCIRRHFVNPGAKPRWLFALFLCAGLQLAALAAVVYYWLIKRKEFSTVGL